jgi:hypothetical protein
VFAVADTGAALVPPAGIAVALDTTGSFADAFGGGPSSTWLVRPDHYIGYRADRLEVEDLAGYLRRGIGAGLQD